MLVGMIPTLLALAGLLALGLLASARRSAALAILPLSAVAVAVAYVVFALRYPSTDGDTIKGTYLLMTLPAAMVGAAFVVDVLRPRRPGLGHGDRCRARRPGRRPAPVPGPRRRYAPTSR